MVLKQKQEDREDEIVTRYNYIILHYRYNYINSFLSSSFNIDH